MALGLAEIGRGTIRIGNDGARVALHRATALVAAARGARTVGVACGDASRTRPGAEPVARAAALTRARGGHRRRERLRHASPGLRVRRRTRGRGGARAHRTRARHGGRVHRRAVGGQPRAHRRGIGGRSPIRRRRAARRRHGRRLDGRRVRRGCSTRRPARGGRRPHLRSVPRGPRPIPTAHADTRHQHSEREDSRRRAAGQPSRRTHSCGRAIGRCDGDVRPPRRRGRGEHRIRRDRVVGPRITGWHLGAREGRVARAARAARQYEVGYGFVHAHLRRLFADFEHAVISKMINLVDAHETVFVRVGFVRTEPFHEEACEWASLPVVCRQLAARRARQYVAAPPLQRRGEWRVPKRRPPFLPRRGRCDSSRAQ